MSKCKHDWAREHYLWSIRLRADGGITTTSSRFHYCKKCGEMRKFIKEDKNE